MIKCLFKGHNILRPNSEFKYAICIECGKLIDDKEIMKLYKKELQKQNKQWMKGRCKEHFKLECDSFFCEFKEKFK